MGNMSTPDLINLAIQLSHILVESPKGRQIKFLIINSSSWRPLNKTNLKKKKKKVLAIIAKSQDIGK